MFLFLRQIAANSTESAMSSFDSESGVNMKTVFPEPFMMELRHLQHVYHDDTPNQAQIASFKKVLARKFAGQGAAHVRSRCFHASHFARTVEGR